MLNEKQYAQLVYDSIFIVDFETQATAQTVKFLVATNFLLSKPNLIINH